MAARLLPIGTSDFRQIRQDGALYVDKTELVARVLADSASVLLLPRPRRFGKTTNLTTLRYFLEKRPEDLSGLFTDLAVWRDEAARAHFQRYSVIYLTFKDLKTASWDQCLADLSLLIANLYAQHTDLLTDGGLHDREAATFHALLERRADHAELRAALRDLSRHLARRDGRPVVLLIDEYDTPLHEAFAHGYYDQAVDVFRGLLSGVIKDNPALFKGVLTGILRIAKESIFSDLNNVAVHSLLQPRYAPFFGFTEPEVAALARQADFPGSLADLREWYNGYLFGETVIYNPWSVLSALDRGTCAAYWVNTSSNELIRELLLRATADQHRELEVLLHGGAVRKPLTESTVLRDIHGDSDALWSFLLFAGYLRAQAVRQEDDASVTAELAVPNRELRSVFSVLFKQWLAVGLGGQRQVEEMTEALLRGDIPRFELHLSRLLVETTSVMDTPARRAMPPEQLYHVFILGLLAYLQPRYLVRSNRESGFGRADVLLVPREPGRPGVVLELKVRRRGQTLQQAAAEGLRQIADNAYVAELQAAGAAPIHAIAVAFDGKKVLVKASPGKPERPTRTAARR